MFRRVLASLLWVWCIATAWSFLAVATVAPAELGPLLGLAVGAVVGIDPLHRIWTTPTPAHDLVREVQGARFEADAI